MNPFPFSYLSQFSVKPDGTLTTSGSVASDFSSSPSAVSRLMSGSAPFMWTWGAPDEIERKRPGVVWHGLMTCQRALGVVN